MIKYSDHTVAYSDPIIIIYFRFGFNVIILQHPRILRDLFVIFLVMLRHDEEAAEYEVTYIDPTQLLLPLSLPTWPIFGLIPGQMRLTVVVLGRNQILGKV